MLGGGVSRCSQHGALPRVSVRVGVPCEMADSFGLGRGWAVGEHSGGREGQGVQRR